MHSGRYFHCSIDCLHGFRRKKPLLVGKLAVVCMQIARLNTAGDWIIYLAFLLQNGSGDWILDGDEGRVGHGPPPLPARIRHCVMRSY